jgi:AcrR family transcriptional regulator
MSITKPASRNPQKQRVRRSPEAARDNILAAAESLLVEKGPQSLKLADVAAAAGVANATVLHHFSSIDGVEAALMERMVQQLVDTILAADREIADPAAAREVALTTLFDAFETRGAARLAAWLELTDESTRLTSVREAIQKVVANRVAHAGLSPAKAENLVLISVVMALGVGLFGRTLGELIGRKPGTARKLAIDMLRTHIDALLDEAKG